MKTIKTYQCNCGEDVYEDDRRVGGHPEFVTCINCGTDYHVSKLQEEEIADIHSESFETD